MIHKVLAPCNSGKIHSFPDYGCAEKFLNHCSRRNRGLYKRQRIYRCPECGMYHLTSHYHCLFVESRKN